MVANRATVIGEIRLSSRVAAQCSAEDQDEWLRQLQGALEEGLAPARARNALRDWARGATPEI